MPTHVCWQEFEDFGTEVFTAASHLDLDVRAHVARGILALHVGVPAASLQLEVVRVYHDHVVHNHVGQWIDPDADDCRYLLVVTSTHPSFVEFLRQQLARDDLDECD